MLWSSGFSLKGSHGQTNHRRNMCGQTAEGQLACLEIWYSRRDLLLHLNVVSSLPAEFCVDYDGRKQIPDKTDNTRWLDRNSITSGGATKWILWREKSGPWRICLLSFFFKKGLASLNIISFPVQKIKRPSFQPVRGVDGCCNSLELAASAHPVVQAMHGVQHSVRAVVRVSVGDIETEAFLAAPLVSHEAIPLIVGQAVLLFQAAQRQDPVDWLEDDGSHHLRTRDKATSSQSGGSFWPMRWWDACSSFCPMGFLNFSAGISFFYLLTNRWKEHFGKRGPTLKGDWTSLLFVK